MRTSAPEAGGMPWLRLRTVFRAARESVTTMRVEADVSSMASAIPVSSPSYAVASAPRYSPKSVVGPPFLSKLCALAATWLSCPVPSLKASRQPSSKKEDRAAAWWAFDVDLGSCGSKIGM